MKKKAKILRKKLRTPRHVIKLLNVLERMFNLENFERFSKFPQHDEENRAMEIEFDLSYLHYTLTYFPAFFKESRENQRDYILHEFCHFVTAEMLKQVEDLSNGKLVTQQQMNAASEKATSLIAYLLNEQLTGNGGYARIGYKKYLDQNKR